MAGKLPVKLPLYTSISSMSILTLIFHLALDRLQGFLRMRGDYLINLLL